MGDLFEDGVDIIHHETIRIIQQRQAQQDKINYSLAISLKRTHAFLDDPEKLDAFNQHVETINNHYLAQNGFIKPQGILSSLKINPDKIDDLKQLEFKTQLNDRIPNILIVHKLQQIHFNPSIVTALTERELQKVITHEIHHGYSFHQQVAHPHYKEELHAMELAADSFSDHVQSWPPDSHIQMKMRSLQYKNNLLPDDPLNNFSVEDIYNALSSIIHELKDDADTHPSVFKRIRNSEETLEKIAPRRMNEYLEQLYEGYIADYQPVQTLFDLNQQDLSLNDRTQATLTPPQIPKKTL